jgi:uncharacterized protein with von Willebrand factor type A (vWA) domain
MSGEPTPKKICPLGPCTRECWACVEIARLAADYQRGQRDMRRRASEAVTFGGDFPTWAERGIMDRTREAILALPIRTAESHG